MIAIRGSEQRAGADGTLERCCQSNHTVTGER